MGAERWHKISEIFQAAIARDADERDAFVMAECGEDAGLLQEVDALVAAHERASGASALNHPNILTIHDIDTVDGVHYLATEYVEGETLRDRITRGPVPLDQAIDIAQQAAGALAAAHEAKIIHRDIKPENIMVR